MRIKTIKKVKPRKVYAISTTTATFISDGLFHHNCVNCNRNLYGNSKAYRMRLILDYGEEAVIDLEMRAKKTCKESFGYLPDYYQGVIDMYSPKIEILKNTCNIIKA